MDGVSGRMGMNQHLIRSIAAILPLARACGVRIALEPLHPMTCAHRSVLSTTAQALDIAEALEPDLGVAQERFGRVC